MPGLPNFESLCDSAVEGVPARRHENESLAKQGVMQYYCEKELAQEDKEQNESLTKAKQIVEIDDQEIIFQKVEGKLQVKPVTKQLTLALGGAKNDHSAESKAKKLQGLYDECLEKRKKLSGDFKKHLVKLEELLNVFEKENATSPSAPVAAMHAELKSLKESLDGKEESFVNRASTYPEKAADPVGQDVLRKLEKLKKELDAAVKSLFHLLRHILDKACKGFNPKDSWNYRDETLAFVVQSLWFKGAGKSTSPGIRAFKFFLKWMNANPFLSLHEASSGSKSLQYVAMTVDDLENSQRAAN